MQMTETGENERIKETGFTKEGGFVDKEPKVEKKFLQKPREKRNVVSERRKRKTQKQIGGSKKRMRKVREKIR